MLDFLAAGACLGTLGSHFASVAVTIARSRPRAQALPAPNGAPKVAVLRPVCGVDTFDEATLRSTFTLDYPNLDLIFCCDRANDPAVALVQRLIAAYPHRRARLLIGRDPLTCNPKLNNLLKSWKHVSADWVIMADSNVDMPPDYVQRLLAGWGAETGVLCSPPIGDRATGFWGDVECAFLNTYQARWQYTADTFGFGFAQGKTMLFRRRDLAQAGGLVALGAEVAEDAAATKLIREQGHVAQLVDAPFRQPLGRRAARQVWDRQARWARLRRMTFPQLFMPELLTTGLVPIASSAVLADNLGLPAWFLAGLVAVLWYGAEAALALSAGWQFSWRSPLAAIVRDLLIPCLWVQAWLSNSFSWRGNEIRADQPATQTS